MPGEFTKEQLQQMLAEAEAESKRNASSTDALPFEVPGPGPRPSADEYAPVIWGRSEFDFVTPSGQKCRMRRIPEQELLTTGILDKVARLPGLAQILIDKAEGKPPSVEDNLKMLSDNEDAINDLIGVLNTLTPLAVLQPKIWPMPTGDEIMKPGRIYPTDIDLGDRVAIMERALQGVKALDSFRAGS